MPAIRAKSDKIKIIGDYSTCGSHGYKNEILKEIAFLLSSYCFKQKKSSTSAILAI
jgi:hypothetical protein